MSDPEEVDLTVQLGRLSLRVRAPARSLAPAPADPPSPASSQGSFVLVPPETSAPEVVDCPPLLRRSPVRSSSASLPGQSPNPRPPSVLGSPGVPVCTSEAREPLASQASAPSSAYPLQGPGPGSTAPCSTPSTSDLSATFPPVSSAALSLGRGISDPSGFRVQRAWTAGLWAGAVLQGLARVVARTPQLALKNRFYIVLRAPGLDGPRLYSNFAVYRRVVQNHSTDSVSHAFPSLAEVRIYCAGAGVACPEEQ